MYVWSHLSTRVTRSLKFLPPTKRHHSTENWLLWQSHPPGLRCDSVPIGCTVGMLLYQMSLPQEIPNAPVLLKIDTWSLEHAAFFVRTFEIFEVFSWFLESNLECLAWWSCMFRVLIAKVDFLTLLIDADSLEIQIGAPADHFALAGKEQ